MLLIVALNVIAVPALFTPDTTVEHGIHHLRDAVTWVEANRTYSTEVAARASILGRYWTGRDTDFNALNEAIVVAAKLGADDYTVTVLAREAESEMRRARWQANSAIACGGK
mgnify:CR=1 FL=1